MRLLTIREVVERTSLSRSTIHELLKSGQLPSAKIGHARRIREVDLDQFIEDRLDRGAVA